jgi:predicted PurR-regulated permease PerM
MQDSKLVKYSVVFVALVLLAIVLQALQAVIRPLAIAILLMFLFTPLVRFSKRRNIPVWLTFAGLFVVVVSLLALISSFVTIDGANLRNWIPQFQERISQNGAGVLEAGSQFGFGLENITPEDVSAVVVSGAAKVLGGIRTLFSDSLMAMILLMFLIQSRPVLFRVIDQKYGKAEVDRLDATFQKIEGDIVAYFGTKTAISLGTAIVSGLVLLLFGAKFIWVSALIVFLLNFVPIIGSLIAVIVVVLLYLLTFGFSGSAIWLMAALMAVQVVFGSILEPKIAGKRLNMSPILIVVSLYVWGWVWGIIGMLLSVVLTTLILSIVKHMGKPHEAPAQ